MDRSQRVRLSLAEDGGPCGVHDQVSIGNEWWQRDAGGDAGALGRSLFRGSGIACARAHRPSGRYRLSRGTGGASGRLFPIFREIPFSAKTKVGALVKLLSSGWDASLVWEPGVAAKAFAKEGIERRLGPDNNKAVAKIPHASD